MVFYDMSTMDGFNKNYPQFEADTLGKTPFIILIFAHWCAHCENMKPSWMSAVDQHSADTPIAQVEHEVFQHLTGVHGDNTLSRLMKDAVKGFPFIATVSPEDKNGVIDVTEYNEGRDATGFNKVMKEVAKKAKTVKTTKAVPSPKTTKAKASVKASVKTKKTTTK